MKDKLRVPMFRIDPEGTVMLTWQSLGVILGAMAWATMQYVELRSMRSELTETTAEVRIHHDSLVRNGLFPARNAP